MDKQGRLVNQLISFFLLFVITISPVYANNAANLNKVINQTSLRLTMIADYMGVTPETRVLYEATNIFPHDVYFQAIRLHNKVVKLLYETTGEISQPYNIALVGETNLKSITTVLGKTDDLLKKIMNKFKIKIIAATPEKQIASNQISSLFLKLILMNQQVNQLVEKQTQPADVYQNVTLAIYYVQALLATMPNTKAVITVNKFVPNKKPLDVYRELIKALDVITQIGKLINIPIITLKTFSYSNIVVKPNDVQELSHIILSNLSYIANEKGLSLEGIQSYYPGKKYPSHVYQRATRLVKELNVMKKFLEKNTNWLKDGSTK